MLQPVTNLTFVCDIIPYIHSLPPKTKNLKNIFFQVYLLMENIVSIQKSDISHTAVIS